VVDADAFDRGAGRVARPRRPAPDAGPVHPSVTATTKVACLAGAGTLDLASTAGFASSGPLLDGRPARPLASHARLARRPNGTSYIKAAGCLVNWTGSSLPWVDDGGNARAGRSLAQWQRYWATGLRGPKTLAAGPKNLSFAQVLVIGLTRLSCHHLAH
jgi:hypothetical protein